MMMMKRRETPFIIFTGIPQWLLLSVVQSVHASPFLWRYLPSIPLKPPPLLRLSKQLRIFLQKKFAELLDETLRSLIDELTQALVINFQSRKKEEAVP